MAKKQGIKDFQDKKVYLVGGSAGIGLATAKLLAAKGAHVHIFARNEERLRSACEEIRLETASSAQQVVWKQLDVARLDHVKSALEKALKDFGTPDILINCAGRAYPHYFEDITVDQFDETMKVNLYGIWHTVSLLAPHMSKQGGHIINTSSIAGLMGVFGYTDYAASKFAVIGLSEALRSELKPQGISVSVLCPPDTDTPGFATENTTKPEETRVISEGARLMTPEAVALALIRGMGRGQFMIIPGVSGRAVVLLKRFFPALVDLFMDMTIKKVRKKRIGS